MLQFAGRLGFLPAINLLTTQQLEQSLKNTGFQIIEKTKFSKGPDAEFTLIAKKPETMQMAADMLTTRQTSLTDQMPG